MHHSTTRILLVFIITLICYSLPVTSTSALDPIETRYMRSDQQTVNGLTAYILGTSQSTTHKSVSWSYSYAYCVGIKVWKRASDGTETEITSGKAVAVVQVPYNSYGYRSATWNCPQTVLNNGDAIVVRVCRCSSDGSYPIVLAEFITEAFSGNNQLDAATWTVTYYLQHIAYSNLCLFYFGSSTYNSRIEGFSWSSGVAKEWHDISTLTFNITAKQWFTLTALNFNILTKTWHLMSLLTFNVTTIILKQWHDMTTLIFNIATKQWNFLETLNFQILTKAWFNIDWLNFNVLIKTWNLIDALTFQISTIGWHIIDWITFNLETKSAIPFPVIIIGAIFILTLSILYIWKNKQE